MERGKNCMKTRRVIISHIAFFISHFPYLRDAARQSVTHRNMENEKWKMKYGKCCSN